MIGVQGPHEWSDGEKPTYQVGLRISLSRMCIWHAWGWSACHLIPDDAELAPEDERGQSDEEKPKQEQRERDQAPEERAWCNLAIADGRDCCAGVKGSSILFIAKFSLTDDDKPKSGTKLGAGIK